MDGAGARGQRSRRHGAVGYRRRVRPIQPSARDGASGFLPWPPVGWPGPQDLRQDRHWPILLIGSASVSGADIQAACGLDLVIMMDAMGQSLADHAVFERITSALVHKARLEPEAVQGLLRSLSRLALSGAHLEAASRLLQALRDCACRPGSLRELSGILWSITLFHFSSVQHKPVDQALAASFVQAWQYFSAAVAQGCADKVTASPDDHWYHCWVFDYWSLPGTANRPVPVALVEGTPAIPYRQAQVFERFRQEMPGHDVRQEARVNQFPVDIMIDGCICVEVDGPAHFAEMLVDRRGQTGRTLVRQRRTKDFFIDHMLRQYGYRVFRIDMAQSADRVDALIRQVQRALDSPLPEAGSGPGR